MTGSGTDSGTIGLGSVAGGAASGSGAGAGAVVGSSTFCSDVLATEKLGAKRAEPRVEVLGSGSTSSSGATAANGLIPKVETFCSITILTDGSFPPLEYDKTKSRNSFFSSGAISLARTAASNCITPTWESKSKTN